MEKKTQKFCWGTPLIIKSNLKYNMGLIRVFEIYSINYCFLVLSKTGIDKNVQSKPALRIFFSRKICMKRVFGFQQKGSLLFLFISMAEVKSVENKQC